MRHRLPEAFVWWLWEYRRTGSGLCTTDGQTVQVIYPGRRWGSWGPDFRGAFVALDGVLVHGDVEVHVRASDWISHGHAGDPEYDGLALHVLFEPPAGPADPVGVPTVALGPHLAQSLDALLAEWERSTPGAPEPACRSLDEAAALLDRAGLARLEAKAARFEGDLTGPMSSLGLVTGAIECLGYASNVAALRALLGRVSVPYLIDLGRIEGSLPLMGVLFGAAGLLPSQRGRLPLDDYTFQVERAAREAGMSGPHPPLGWRWRGCRPANTPVRRVAATAALVAPARADDLSTQALGALMELPPPRVNASLRALVARSGDGYWQGHADFGRPLARAAAVLGPQRAADIVVNAALPWALALARSTDDSQLEATVIAAYCAHSPLADNQITRHMARQVIGTEAARVLTTACRQQGLIHLYQGWCDGRDCGQCPAGGGEPQLLW